jgi:chemotaxis protein CheD
VKHIVGVADMRVSGSPGDVIVTHALGSCLGVAAHDPVAGVGGLLHVMLPEARANRQKAAANPFMFVDTGVPAFFRALYEAGGLKARLVVKVAGGANVHSAANDRFQIGKRNYVILKKLLWTNSVLIDAEDTGGTAARTMYLQVGPGRVWLNSGGVEREL